MVPYKRDKGDGREKRWTDKHKNENQKVKRNKLISNAWYSQIIFFF